MNVGTREQAEASMVEISDRLENDGLLPNDCKLVFGRLRELEQVVFDLAFFTPASVGYELNSVEFFNRLDRLQKAAAALAKASP